MSVETKKGEPQSVIIAAGATCDSTFHGATLWGISFPDVVAKLIPSSMVARVKSRVESQAKKAHGRTGCTHGITIQFEHRAHDEKKAQRFIPEEEL